MPRQQSHRKGLCCLSLDAGGPRAISQLKMLSTVIHRLNFEASNEDSGRPCAVFDMICGVGSGGFIAIMLAVLGLTAEQALDEFMELSSTVLELRDLDAQARTQALRHYIAALLYKSRIHERTRLLDPNNRSGGCKLVVPLSYRSHVQSICTLRNFEVAQEQTPNLTIFDALLATLAIPPLFTSTTVIMTSNIATIDYLSGELVLSNPIRELLAQAHGAYGPEAGVACILSLGCGHPGIIALSNEESLHDWHHLAERLATDSEQTARDMAVQMNQLSLYHRLSVTRGLEIPVSAPPSNAGHILTHTEVYLADLFISQTLDICVDSLKIRDSIASLRQLTRSGSHRTPAPSRPWMTRSFVMRKEPWEIITKAMLAPRDVERPRIMAVTGIGGCGKTQLVLKFMQEHESRFSSQIFIDGSSKTRIRTDVIRHVRSLGVEHSQMTFEDCLLFLAQGSSDRPRLVLYDNVDDPDLDLASLLPLGEGCAIIITSRNRSIGRLCPDAHLPLDVMSTEESVGLLLQIPSGSLSSETPAFEEACAIAQALGCLPIALTQACSYMYETQCTRRAYLERLIKGQQKLLAQPVKHQPEMRYLSTYAAFDASFENLPSRSQQFIQLISFFHWSKVPLELIALAAEHEFLEYEQMYVEHGEDFDTGKTVLENIFLVNGEWDATNLDEITISLQNYSLITLVPGMDTTLLQMHPLVHAWAQSSISAQARVEYQSAAIILLALGARNEHTVSAQYLANHVLHFSPLWEQLNINEAEAFGRTLNGAGIFEGALQLRERVVTELRKQIGTDGINIHDSLWSLAHTYCNLGRYVEAEMLQVEVVKMMKDQLGELHPETIRAASNLVLTYRGLGRLNDARILQAEVLRLNQEVHGDDHPDTTSASNNLAECYRSLGWLREAEVLQMEVLRVRKGTQGERHPDTISATNNLAETYRSLGRLEEAKIFQKEVLRLRREVQGASHPDTIRASSNLALTYRDLGRLEDAEALQEDVLRLRTQVMGQRHPKTAKAMLNLAGTYEIRGKQALAFDLVTTAEDIIAKTLGETHSQYRRCLRIKARIQGSKSSPYHEDSDIASSNAEKPFSSRSPESMSRRGKSPSLFTRLRPRLP